MPPTDAQSIAPSDLPSRTSILVAAIRAFGSREPDESVRNPDSFADLLIGPAELALIHEHPVSGALMQEYAQASENPVIMIFAGLMLWRTRFIDEALKRAVKNGAMQVVVLGAGFDSRAYRFHELLKDCKVIEVDAAPTQAYKMRRIKEVIGQVPANLTYCAIDFAKDELLDGLRRAGFSENRRTFYIWEGVCMYLAESNVRETLQMVASYSAPGSSLVLDYTNNLGLEFGKLSANGAGGIPTPWAEPWTFGVPGDNGEEFFRNLGFDPGDPLSTSNPEIVKRYGTRQDGTSYASRALEKMRSQAPKKPQTLPNGLLKAQSAIAAAGGSYWFAELTLVNRVNKN